ncbi:MAG: beta-lactamase family protein [Planctomycetes bacterium]|nr:beta-lactamase family protein [Planctomycetota bacterium]
MRQLCGFAGVLLLGVSCAVTDPVAEPASAPARDAIAELVREELARQKIPGLSLAIVEHGRLVRAEGFGFANLEHLVPAKAETIYQSGSIGKQFTAALVLMLAQDGRFALDDPIARHLPGTPPSWERLTIRQLLQHTSGLADPYAKLDLTREYTEAELLAIDGQLPLLFEPGAKFSYSNMGYHVLGFLCSHVGGAFYGEQLAQRIFAPAGMRTARIISERELVLHRAAGYELEDGQPKNQRWASPSLNTTADGSLYLSVLDFAAWDLSLTRGTPLGAELQAVMREPARLADGTLSPYGCGWSVEPFEGREAISHGGAWQGFTTFYLRLPREELSVIVLTNRAGADPGVIVKRIALQRLEERGSRPGSVTAPR